VYGLDDPARIAPAAPDSPARHRPTSPGPASAAQTRRHPQGREGDAATDMPLWSDDVWTASPLMRSLGMGVAAGLIGTVLSVLFFDNILISIAAYALFGAVGIVAAALR
jgi:hypothetical protein